MVAGQFISWEFSTRRRLTILVVICVCAVSLHFTIQSPLRLSLIIAPKSDYRQKTGLAPAPSDPPTVARVLYLFLCESQAEVNGYSQIFPSASADVVFLCWRENCTADKFRPTKSLSVAAWSSGMERNRTLVLPSNQSLVNFDERIFHRLHSRVFIINEKQLQLKKKLTWTTSRNKLYDFALSEERKQGWRWAYFTFVDGDVHIACPLGDQLLANRSRSSRRRDDNFVFASRFLSLVDLDASIGEARCFLLFDAFLLSASPAIAIASGAYGPLAFPGLLTQIVYHIDAMLNAIQRDAAQFVLPYCSRYDSRNWWTSQVIFVHRSICMYGHSIQFDGIQIANQTHRSYPRQGNPWKIDNDMNLLPAELIALKSYMKDVRFVSPLMLRHYGGWSIAMVSEACRLHHTAMILDTCLVHGNRTDR